jgi:RNA polymerase sigma-70 factor (ECF subfamily)
MEAERQKTSIIEPLYSELHDDLLGYFRRRVASPEVAEDLLQEAFVKLLGRLEGGGSVANAQAYLFRLARNLVVDHYRRRKDSSPPPELSDDSQEEERNEGTRRDIAGWMRRFISYLPSPYSETLLLSEIRELPYAEIAAQLGVTLGTVKSRVHRGRELLRRRLVACCRFLYDARGRVVDYEPHRRRPGKKAERPEGADRSGCSSCG